MSGLIFISRDVFNHDAFTREKFTELTAWLWLLVEAAWKQRKILIGDQVVTLERGQLSHSHRFIAQKWGWSKSKVGRFLKRLKSETMIGTETVSDQLVITICNYDIYQDVVAYRKAKSGTDGGTVVGQSWDKEENLKNLKDKKTIQKKAKRLSTDWKPTAEQIDYALSKGMTKAVANAEAENFLDYFVAKPGATSLDWNRNWRRWVRTALEFAAKRGNVPAPTIVQPAKEITPTQWRSLVKLYRQTPSTWESTDAIRYRGPAPGEPGCRVPKHILEEFGFEIRKAAEGAGV